MPLEQSHITLYRNLFINRDDAFALQTAKGSYFLNHSPVSDELIENHLRGRVTAGWYALSQNDCVKWVCLDADQADGMEKLQEAWKELEGREISAYLEDSRRGGHLWVLFEEGVKASSARSFILNALPQLEQVEVFPKQDRLDPDTQYGSLVRGPLGIHKLTQQRYPFLDPQTLKPVSRTVVGSLEYLAQAQRVSLEKVAEVESQPLPERKLDLSLPFPSQPRTRRGLSPLEQIKAEMGDPYEFISRFVQLDERGRGHCPFHPPDRNPSFAVNRAGGYWIDFHELNPRTGRYVGGDAISFYKRLTGLSYKEALRQLQDELEENE